MTGRNGVPEKVPGGVTRRRARCRGNGSIWCLKPQVPCEGRTWVSMKPRRRRAARSLGKSISVLGWAGLGWAASLGPPGAGSALERALLNRVCRCPPEEQGQKEPSFQKGCRGHGPRVGDAHPATACAPGQRHLPPSQTSFGDGRLQGTVWRQMCPRARQGL